MPREGGDVRIAIIVRRCRIARADEAARRSKIVWAFPSRLVTESRLNPTAMNGECRIAIADFAYVGCHLGIVGMTWMA